MKGEVSVMDALWEVITSTSSNLITLMGNISTGLLANDIFKLVIGIIMFGIGMSVVFTLVRKLRRRGK